MPRRDNIGLTLKQTHDLGMLIRGPLQHVSANRHYHPADMVMLLGNIEVDSMMGRLKCEDCGLKDATEVSAIHPPASERQSIRVRTLTRHQDHSAAGLARGLNSFSERGAKGFSE